MVPVSEPFHMDDARRLPVMGDVITALCSLQEAARDVGNPHQEVAGPSVTAAQPRLHSCVGGH